MLFQRNRLICLTNRPFQGSGAKLYGGMGSPASIPYRPQKILDPRHLPINPTTVNDVSLATVASPGAALTCNLPPAWWNRSDIWLQVRTFSGDLENETLFEPRNVSLDASGNLIATIDGAFRLLPAAPVSGGSTWIRFMWVSALSCAAPLSLALVCVSGPTSISTIVVPPAGRRLQEIPVSGLVPGTYVFRLEARSGSVVNVLKSSISLVVSAAPSSTASLVVTES